MEPAAMASADADLPHILVVDDDPGVRDSMRLLLEIEDYRVTTAATRAEALAHAHQHPDIAIVIADFHLGDEERGTDVIRAIRSILGNGVKALLLTGDTSSATDKMADQSYPIVRKPVTPDTLLELLGSLLGRG